MIAFQEELQWNDLCTGIQYNLDSQTKELGKVNYFSLFFFQ